MNEDWLNQINLVNASKFENQNSMLRKERETTKPKASITNGKNRQPYT